MSSTGRGMKSVGCKRVTRLGVGNCLLGRAQWAGLARDKALSWQFGVAAGVLSLGACSLEARVGVVARWNGARCRGRRGMSDVGWQVEDGRRNDGDENTEHTKTDSTGLAKTPHTFK